MISPVSKTRSKKHSIARQRSPVDLLQLPNPEIAKHDAFAVAGKSEVSVFWDFRIEFGAHEFGDTGKVGTDNGRAVEFHLNGGALHPHDLIVPFVDGSQVTAGGSGLAVNTAVILAGIELGILFGGVVEHLKFAHATVSWVAMPGIADGQAVVATAGRFEL